MESNRKKYHILFHFCPRTLNKGQSGYLNVEEGKVQLHQKFKWGLLQLTL